MAHKVFGKRALPLVLAVLAAGNGMAQENEETAEKPGLFSIGTGILFCSEFGGSVTAKYGGGLELSKTYPYLGGGFFAFADAKYLEISLGYQIAGGKPEVTENGNTEKDNSWLYTSYNLGLFGKCPINVSKKFVLFPLLGIEYQLMRSVNDGKKNISNAGDLSALWFKGGVGGDVALTTKLYLRGEALYGIRLANKFEKDGKKQAEKIFAAYDPDVSIMRGHGLTIKVAVGFRR